MAYTTAGGWTADTSSNGGCLHRTPLGMLTPLSLSLSKSHSPQESRHQIKSYPL